MAGRQAGYICWAQPAVLIQNIVVGVVRSTRLAGWGFLGPYIHKAPAGRRRRRHVSAVVKVMLLPPIITRQPTVVYTGVHRYKPWAIRYILVICCQHIVREPVGLVKSHKRGSPRESLDRGTQRRPTPVQKSRHKIQSMSVCLQTPERRGCIP